MKKDNIVEKALKLVAEVTCESSSWIGFYEPKMPEKLRKMKNQNKYQSR